MTVRNLHHGGKKMQDMVAIVLTVIAVAAGIWCWWFENGGKI